MNAIVILFLVGVVLLAAEVFMPGAILGILGGLALLAGVSIAFVQHGADGGLLALAVAAGLLGLAFFCEFYVLPRTALGKRLFLRASVDGVSQPAPGPDDLVGRVGEADTLLSPSGYVRVDGRRFEAFCRSGQAPKGASVRIVGVDTFRLIVTQT
jgi:membrane-bound ClpP family serine protease